MSMFNIKIASVPDRENLVAEIWCQEKLIAELNQEENLMIEFYLEPNSNFDFDELIGVLKKAKEKLQRG